MIDTNTIKSIIHTIKTIKIDQYILLAIIGITIHWLCNRCWLLE